MQKVPSRQEEKIQLDSNRKEPALNQKALNRRIVKVRQGKVRIKQDEKSWDFDINKSGGSNLKCKEWK